MTASVHAGQPRVVVITGASSGIGRETALRYAARHDLLVVAARTESMLLEVAEECLAAGARNVVVHPTDIGDADAVQRLFDVALESFGRVDVAVQCAAVTAFGRFEDVPAEVFERIIRTNLIGAANVARCALGHFQGRGDGHLVLVGSLLGRVAVPYQSAYVASKFALNGLVRSLRQENRSMPGVRVHGIYPGPVDTPVYGTSVNYLEQTPRVPPSADAPATVARAIVGETDHDRSTERYVGWVNVPAIVAYHVVPGVFDALVGPLVRATLFTTTRGHSRPRRRLPWRTVGQLWCRTAP
ncbi:SDR family NAD(P)-dependent oxidoreductase [Mycobacterium yunnanensis]|uniref:SDR family NAD(P)-dependent oxidoreductase n=1 Tax=Mycobacterium yunnanensis TaxID=368477 RepID=A0A9X2YJ82_9MYCO|nr:SDR family NAD(P)-dependent oxidoreductase [Mycobacterium yunnanensis]MCV7420297.1 SDR family NAD(P)-dependent oxidoreductase [Mycobacterium yunnanensis]